MNEQSPNDPQQDRPVPPPDPFGTGKEGAAAPHSSAPSAGDSGSEAVPPRVIGNEETAPIAGTPIPSPAPSPDPAPEQTAVLGAPWQPAQPDAGQFAPAGAATAAKKKRRGAGVGIVVASLLLGGAAGFGGAAAFHALDDDASAGSSSPIDVIDQGPSEAGAGSVEAVAAKVLPSVVQIYVSSSSGSGTGSGIILSEDGRILTNNHVVEGAGGGDSTLRVSFADGSRADATVVGTDPLTDTAIIQAKGVSGLTPATIGNSANLRVGQEVVAIGAPYGLDATVTSGIVSALDRPVNVGSTGVQGNSTTYPAIQTDAAINPGNSGGPLVDMTGSVVGINSSIRTAGSSDGGAGSIGLGFAIPIDPMLPVIQQMSDGATPTHARLGITVSDPENSSNDIGAQIGDVTDSSAAGKAGLKPGDIITKVDDHPIDSADDLVATIRTYRPGDKVTITYLRGGKEATTTVTLDSDEGDATSQDSGASQQDQDEPGQGQGGLGGFRGFDWNR